VFFHPLICYLLSLDHLERVLPTPQLNAHQGVAKEKKAIKGLNTIKTNLKANGV